MYLFAFRAGDTRWNCFTQHVYTLRSLRLVSQINSSYIKSEQYTHTYIPHNLTQYWHSKQDLCSLYYYSIRHLHANWHVTRCWQNCSSIRGNKIAQGDSYCWWLSFTLGWQQWKPHWVLTHRLLRAETAGVSDTTSLLPTHNNTSGILHYIIHYTLIWPSMSPHQLSGLSAHSSCVPPTSVCSSHRHQLSHIDAL